MTDTAYIKLNLPDFYYSVYSAVPLSEPVIEKLKEFMDTVESCCDPVAADVDAPTEAGYPITVVHNCGQSAGFYYI